MLSRCLVNVYNLKLHFLPVSSGTTTIYSPSKTKFSLKYLNYPKINKELFYFKIISIVMPKNINNTKKLGQILI